MDVSVASLFFAMLALTTLTGSVLFGFAMVRRGDAAGLEASAALMIAWLIAATAVAGSLYYSEVVGFEPCKLCWWQRIGMYPLVLVLGVAALRRDSGVWRYALPLTLAGLGVSTFHYLLQQFPTLGGGGCSATAPCNAAYVWEFGLVSIPFMAGVGFFSISVLLLSIRRSSP
ncbi:MAG: disulfide oxidoreductase [Nitriliruptorales bacterium]|nr:disulfide oxidoreductase [Nitriliruptorales bacterium]